MYYQVININTAIAPDAHIPHQKYAFVVKFGKIVDGHLVYFLLGPIVGRFCPTLSL